MHRYPTHFERGAAMQELLGRTPTARIMIRLPSNVDLIMRLPLRLSCLFMSIHLNSQKQHLVTWTEYMIRQVSESELVSKKLLKMFDYIK
jgi:hypothetical protein